MCVFVLELRMTPPRWRLGAGHVLTDTVLSLARSGLWVCAAHSVWASLVWAACLGDKDRAPWSLFCLPKAAVAWPKLWLWWSSLGTGPQNAANRQKGENQKLGKAKIFLIHGDIYVGFRLFIVSTYVSGTYRHKSHLSKFYEVFELIGKLFF